MAGQRLDHPALEVDAKRGELVLESYVGVVSDYDLRTRSSVSRNERRQDRSGSVVAGDVGSNESIVETQGRADGVIAGSRVAESDSIGGFELGAANCRGPYRDGLCSLARGESMPVCLCEHGGFQ